LLQFYFFGFLLNRLLIGRGVNLGFRRCFFLRSRTRISATKTRNRIVSVIRFYGKLGKGDLWFL